MKKEEWENCGWETEKQDGGSGEGQRKRKRSEGEGTREERYIMRGREGKGQEEESREGKGVN